MCIALHSYIIAFKQIPQIYWTLAGIVHVLVKSLYSQKNLVYIVRENKERGVHTSLLIPWFCSVLRKLSSTSRRDGYLR